MKLLILKCVHCHLGEIERRRVWEIYEYIERGRVCEMEGDGDCGKYREWEVIIKGRGWRSERGGVRKM